MKDPRLPDLVKRLLWLAFVYLICPFDLKSDFLPGGFWDDSLIVPLIIITAILLIPKPLLQDAKLGMTRVRLGLILLSISSIPLAEPTGAECLSPIRPASISSWKDSRQSSIYIDRDIRRQTTCRYEYAPLPSILIHSKPGAVESVKNSEGKTSLGGDRIIRPLKLCSSGDDSAAPDSHAFGHRIFDLLERSTAEFAGRPFFTHSFWKKEIKPC